MHTMKTSLMMDKICDIVLHTVMLAAMPVAALTTLLQAF